MASSLSTRQIAEAGRLLVRYRLLLEGIETTPVETPTRYHLATRVAQDEATTIAVYANRAPKPAGGTGRAALAWMLDGTSEADLVAVADLSTNRVWIFRTTEAIEVAQQHPPSGEHHLIMVTDPGLTGSKHDRILDTDFSEFLLERRAAELLTAEVV